MGALPENWLASKDRNTRLRLRRTGLAALDYVVMCVILIGFAALGTISYRVPLILLGATLLINALFLSLIASGWSRRWPDPSLTAVQVFAACAVNLAGMMMAPQLAHVFIVVLFMPLSYASLHFTQRMYLAIWLYLSVAVGVAIVATGAFRNVADHNWAGQLLFWAVVVFTIGRFLSINAVVSRLRLDLKKKNEELQSATGKLTELASRDELTGLWNRREFMRLLQDEARRAARSQTSFCVAIIDIDHFKEVNDKYGHLVGDAVLHELGQLLEFSRRATDSLGRYGGEEFTLLLQGARASTATVALERTRNLVAQHDWSGIAPDLHLTISAGIGAWHPGDTLTVVMNRADSALYEAKNAGRNCVRTVAR
ncbi:GGDEF domain-containing protein [Lacisediminimonas sp.]|uniref:GGDEF domain-containing protein n=1 Tax=Lacisediminimonas sp. TaxID=3060582 RepID=UPI00271C06C1|nr:GGDEF domain-containing protein [Lacisediminimonas sp.]MDO8298588.1 GGDEF domain-containing protein [Lacisediminimonas sp.]